MFRRLHLIYSDGKFSAYRIPFLSGNRFLFLMRITPFFRIRHMYENKMRKRMLLGLKEEHPFPQRRWMFCGLQTVCVYNFCCTNVSSDMKSSCCIFCFFELIPNIPTVSAQRNQQPVKNKKTLKNP